MRLTTVAGVDLVGVDRQSADRGPGPVDLGALRLRLHAAQIAHAANTGVGAVAGAMPILMGWTAMGGQLDLPRRDVVLDRVLWQFPHFMAIAWMYRREYGAAGLQMLTVVDPSGSPRRPAGRGLGPGADCR